MPASNGRFRNTPRDKVVSDAIAAAGGVKRFAFAIGISPQAVYAGWKRIPAERVNQVSRLTGIPPGKLRPDIFKE